MLHLILAVLLLSENTQNVDSRPIQEAKKDLQVDWFTRALQYMESNPETLDELLSKDYALTEGDMLLSSDRNAVESIWPTHEIPFVISPELASRTDDLLTAMEMVSNHICVRFHRRTSETNYLLFTESKGCASYVGFIGGEQPVFVGPPCIVGNIAHELLHALGFHHEHTRSDREEHITILHHNIMAGMEGNFKMHKGETFGVPYDITSIMHYGSGFFSSNGLPTIIPTDDTKDMGQRVRLTERDIERARRLYSCDDVTKKEEKKKEESVEKKEEDSNRLWRDAAKKQEDQTPASLQQQPAASGGRNSTSKRT